MQNKLTALHEKAKGMHAVMAGKYNESVEVNEAMDQKKFSAGAKALTAYAKKNGGIDKADFMKAAKMLDQIGRINILQAGQLLSQLNRFVNGLDTDVRERIYVELKKVGLIESVQEANKSMKSRFGGAVDSKKFDAYKKFVKQHNVDEPTVRMVIDNPNDAESKRMMKIANIAKAVELRKAAMKESVQEAKVECPKCKGEGCDHCDGKGYHMTEVRKYTPPTKAEIEADKKKDRAGKSRPSISAKSANKSVYKNMMGGLKKEELEEAKQHAHIGGVKQADGEDKPVMQRNSKIKEARGIYTVRMKDGSVHKRTLDPQEVLKIKANPNVATVSQVGVAREEVEIDEAKFTDKQIKMAYGILNDPRYKSGNMTAIVKKIEQIAKGLSKHPGVMKAIKVTNENVDERKLTPKEIKRALASGKAKAKPKSQVSLKKAPFEIPEGLEEKLEVSDGLGAWIKDFQKSDAPQFEGKSEKERKEMAIAAYLSAKKEEK
jgi:hypothetical protein